MSDLSNFLIASLTFLVLCLGSATETWAATITFAGSRVALNNSPAAPNSARCSIGPNLLITPSPGAGTSNLGDFNTAESFCLDPSTGNLYNGLFTYNFANVNTLLGTFTGTAQPAGNNLQSISSIFSITGGSGLFAGATGTLLGVGQVTTLPSGLTNSTLDFTGTINTVPEPATMLLFGAALAGLGGKLIRRRVV
jgi:hypothetical protein